MSTQAQELYEGVFSLFQEADRATRDFAEWSGARCRRGCGACCLSPEVQSSAIEMWGVVASLRESGLFERSLERLESEPDRKTCLFYESDPRNPQKGSCGVYKSRPLICRLFAFAGRRSKYGEVEVSHCRVHLEDDPELRSRTEQGLEAGSAVPLFQDYRLRLLALVPNSRYSDLLPINSAFLRAAELEYFDQAM